MSMDIDAHEEQWQRENPFAAAATRVKVNRHAKAETWAGIDNPRSITMRLGRWDFYGDIDDLDRLVDQLAHDLACLRTQLNTPEGVGF